MSTRPPRSARPVAFRIGATHLGSELTPDQVEFGRAMAAYQKRYRVRYPAWSEVLYVLHTLGYARVVPGADYSEATEEDSTTESQRAQRNQQECSSPGES